MDASCMQLSIEGERLLKAGDYQNAIDHFEAALRVGTDDYEVLSAVYNQLGNACFYSNNFHKALEYHKKDLEIAEKLGDRQGQAKAFGNLGNTFKSLKNYRNAIRCCEAHLEITRELGDRLGEGRACYNLGNVHHALGKSNLQSKDKETNAKGRKSVMTAVDYYKSTLGITADLKDTAGEGRAVGNLGNAYTAIGEYTEAIKYHKRRLKIAEDANDMAAKARACGNLGNAFSALGEFSEAVKYYQQSLSVAKESNNTAGQGQAYYCLGSTYVMLKNYVKAVEFHEQHLAVAEQLGDKQGQLRGWYSLRNAHHKMGDTAKTVYYHRLIRENNAPQGSAATQPASLSTPKPQQSQQPSSNSTGSSQDTAKDTRRGRKSANSGGLKKLFKPKKTGEVEEFKIDDSDDDDDVVRTRSANEGKSKSSSSGGKKKRNSAMEWLDEALKEPVPQPSPNAGKRSATPDSMGGGGGGTSTLPSTDFFDMLLSMQATRIDDQRSPDPAAGAVGAMGAMGGGASGGMGMAAANGSQSAAEKAGAAGSAEDEMFFDMLMASQASRLDQQRSPAPKPVGASRPNSKPQADASPSTARRQKAADLDADNMSFFEMLAAAKS